MIENRQLRYFVTAARLLHITRASEALHIAQPALTRNIHQLEEELGVALFHRVRKRISLTEAGQTFLVEAERLLEQLEESMIAAQKAARGELGRLVIGFVSTAGLVAVPQLIAAFRNRYPGPMIVLKELESEELDLALRNGTVDVGLQYGPHDEGELSVRLLEADRFVVALPHDHRLATADRVNLRDLADDYFVIPNRATGGPMTDAILEECSRAGFRPRTAHEITTTTVQTTLGLISASIGVSLIPSALWPFSRKGVVFRPICKNHVALHLNLLWRPQNTAAVLRNFLSTVDRINAP